MLLARKLIALLSSCLLLANFVPSARAQSASHTQQLPPSRNIACT